MVDTIFPTPGTYTARQGRQTQAAGFAGATAARPLGALTGVRPGTPANTVTATTSTVTVQPFGGVADVQTTAAAGPYEFAFDAVATFTLTAQSASVPRSDIVYVQFNDNQEDGTGAANSSSISRVYQAGTTVTIPTPPNTRTMVIAVINVPIVGSAPTVTWVAPYAVAAGGVVPFNLAADRTAYSPRSGDVAFVLADKSLAVNRGSGWGRIGGLLGKASLSSQFTNPSVAFATVLSVTANASGGEVIVDWNALVYNGNSGADRQINWQVTLDGTPIAPVSAGGQSIPLAGAPRIPSGMKVWSTPSAGSHTWALQVSASASSSVIVELAAMTVTEI